MLVLRRDVADTVIPWSPAPHRIADAWRPMQLGCMVGACLVSAGA